ncbi:MAG: NAD(P)-binding domain-containing protein [Rhodococcus sp. (in: high G+C Gram-positive bacteria)]|uniref:flavin-containing monooxygenase n=1 Tax=Rhodococcus sp. TaxID=1831 RepID=UPI003BB176EA
MTTEQFDTVVIGAGQAGLATGYHLARLGVRFVILDAHDRVGDVWRQRFDSLRLYTPAKYDGLPGWGMPAKDWSWPGKDQVAAYFEEYAARFSLPVRTGVTADGLSRRGDGYAVTAGADTYLTHNVVVATGTWQTPVLPDFAEQLDSRIRQLHSSDYRNPGQLQDGPVLVVGCSHSGADIALEVSAEHPTTICGPVRGEAPFDIEGRAAHIVVPIMWWLAHHVLTERTPIGRKVRSHVRSGGGPLLRVRRADLAAAGVRYVPDKVTNVRSGMPVLADGTTLDVRNVIWCTGFGKDISWIDLSVTGADGWPSQKRGVSMDHPGLYFVGLPFLQSFASMLTGGVGRDAEYVANRIARVGRRRMAGV